MRIAVAGFGNRVSDLIYGPIKQVEPSVRVVAIVDPDREGAISRLSEDDAKDISFYETLEEMVMAVKPDALAIGTRCNLHTPYALQAAKFDIPLFLEKPVAISMEQAIALEEAFEKSRCQVVVSFPLRVSPLASQTSEIISAREFGEPVHIMSWNYVTYGTVYWEQGYRDYGITQGLFLQKATHDLDCMSYFMNSPIVRVAAMGTFGKVFGGDMPSGLKCSECNRAAMCLESPANRKRNTSGWHEKDHLCLYSVDCGSKETGTNEDASSALVEFASGAHGIYTQVFFTRRDAGSRGSKISSYKGTVEFDWKSRSLKHVWHHRPFSSRINADASMSHFGGDLELAYDFIGLIKGTAVSRVPIQVGIQSVYACIAARDSALTGEFVKVRQVGS